MWTSLSSSGLGLLNMHVCFLPRLGKFSAAIASNRFSLAFFLLLKTITQMLFAQMLLHLIFQRGPLTSSFKELFFSCLAWLLSTILSSRFPIHSSTFSNLLIPCSVFFNYCILIGSFYIFFPFAEVLTVYPLLSQAQTLLQTPLGRLFISILFSSYEVLSCSFVWNTILSPHFVWLCVCFYVLGR